LISVLCTYGGGSGSNSDRDVLRVDGEALVGSSSIAIARRKPLVLPELVLERVAKSDELIALVSFVTVKI
jgi:hypothetical protein